MRKSKELNRRNFSNFGFSTILIAFVMICIVIFSALALMTANSDYKLSQKVADRTRRYYFAEKEVTLRLRQIDEILANAYAQSSNRTTYYALARKHLNSSKLAIELTDASSSTLAVSYGIRVKSNQTLNVEIIVTYPADNGNAYYKLTRWQTTDLQNQRCNVPPGQPAHGAKRNL